MASIWRRGWRGFVPAQRRRIRRKLQSQAFEKRGEFAGRGLRLESLEKRYALDAAPLLDPSASPLLNSVVEDVGVPVGAVGTLVSALIDDGGALSNFSDANGDLPAIAITDVNLGGGTLHYSLDNGTSWSEAGAVSADSAIVLHADSDTRLAFTPAADFNGAISDVITFKAWDRGDGHNNGASGVDVRQGVIDSFSTGGLAQAAAISPDGNTVYVAGDFGGLKIIDTGSLSLQSTYSSATFVKGITLSQDGNTAYIAAYSEGIHVLNVTDPASPTFYDDYDTVGNAQKILLSNDGNTAYVADLDGGVQILNVSDPDDITFVGAFDTDGIAHDLALSPDGDTLYVADNTNGVLALNISIPESPSLITTATSSPSAFGITISDDGSTLFVADSYNGLRAYDIGGSQGGSLTLRSTYNTSGNALGVALSSNGAVAYVADESSGVQIISVSDLDTPAPIATFNTPGMAYGVAVDSTSDNIYVADYHMGLQVTQHLDAFSVDTDIISIDVSPVNDPGAFSGDTSGTGAEDDSSLTGTLTFTDSIDGDTALTFTVSSDASNGTASIDAAGVWTYVPNQHFNGSDSFTVTVTDDDGHDETQVITLTVSPVNDPGSFSGDTSGTGSEDDSSLTGTLTFTDAIDGDSAPNYTVISAASNGTASIDAAGVWTYAPNDTSTALIPLL